MGKRRLYNGKIIKVTILDEYHDFEVCYIGKDKICLLAKYPMLKDVDFWTADKAEWDVEFTYDGNMYTGKCRIPSMEDLQKTCNDYTRDFKYWTSSKWHSEESATSAYFVSENGEFYRRDFNFTSAALPFIIAEI